MAVRACPVCYTTTPLCPFIYVCAAVVATEPRYGEQCGPARPREFGHAWRSESRSLGAPPGSSLATMPFCPGCPGTTDQEQRDSLARTVRTVATAAGSDPQASTAGAEQTRRRSSLVTASHRGTSMKRCGNGARRTAVEKRSACKSQERRSPSRFPPPSTALGNRQPRDFHIAGANMAVEESHFSQCEAA